MHHPPVHSRKNQRAGTPTVSDQYDEVTKHGYGSNKVRKSWYRKQGCTNSRGHVTNKYRTLVRHNTRSFNSYWAQTRAQQARAQEERYRLDSMKRAQLLAAAKAKAEWRKKENNKSSILGGIGGFFKDTFGTWDGWKNRVLPTVGFGTCLFVSAGTCVLAGAAGAVAVYGGDYLRTGEWDGEGFAKTLTWTVAGGAVAGGVARAMGASWRTAYTGNAFARSTVNNPLYRTKMGYGTGPGGGRKGWVTQPAEVVHPGRTALNMGVNSQLSWGFCGAGSGSALAGSGC